jgi:parvulin-like peptidyl-prolyl isomerase
MMLKLTEMAEKNELDKLSPTKEALEYNRSFILSSAQLSNISQTVQIPAGEHEKYYEANRDRYQQVQLKAIYIPFGSAKVSGAKQSTEADAKAIADKLVAKLRGGSDFVAMVKEYSQDEDSKKKDGDFPIIRKSDNIPDAIRAVVFGMKKGDISEPVRQPNGFYIFRAEEVTARPLSQVKGEIDADLREKHARAIVDGIVRSLDIKYEHQGLSGAPPAPPPSLRK